MRSIDEDVMTREVAAKILNRFFSSVTLPRCNGKRMLKEAVDMAIEALKQPEIIRCKDCDLKEGDCCAYSAVYLRPNGFCQWGRKKESRQ